jgi:hypothetical protein
MGTTTNNGWTYPESTDLVKDGATAIQTLADDIDTTLGVYAPSTSGLTLINTTSFSGVSSQSINNVFSATYDNYRILLNHKSNVDTTIYFRLRNAGTDSTSANYSFAGTLVGTSFTPTRDTALNQTTLTLVSGKSANYSSLVLDLSYPFKTEIKTGVYGTSVLSSGPTAIESFCGAIIMGQTTTFDGFSIYPSGGVSPTITGTVSVYGYNK